MDIKQDTTYPVGVETLLAAFCDKSWLEAKFSALGVTAEVTECAADGDGFRIVSKRTVEADIPGFAAKVLPSKSTVVQTDTWAAALPDGTRKGTWSIHSPNAPMVKASGTMTVKPVDGGCLEEIRGKVSVSIPLVGGKIADFVGKQALETMHEEQAYQLKVLKG